MGKTNVDELQLDDDALYDSSGNQILAAQQSTIAALTDNSGGTASDTLASITGGGSACEDATKNAVASLAAKVDAILTALKAHGIIASS